MSIPISNLRHAFFLFKQYSESGRCSCCFCTATASVGPTATASKPVSDLARCSFGWHGNSGVSALSGHHGTLLRACRWLLPVTLPVPSRKKLTRWRPCFIYHTMWVARWRLRTIHYWTDYMFCACFMCIGCWIVIACCSCHECWPAGQLSDCRVAKITGRHAKRSCESWIGWSEGPVLCTPAIVLRPFVLRPFALTSLANLHHWLICALTFSF